MITLQEIADTIKSKGKYWIAFTGDSITSCEWVHPNWREIVEYVLKQKLDDDWGFKTFNLAYDGATTKDILEKIDEINSIKPDLTVLMVGGNDPFLNVNVENHKANIEKIKSRIASKLVFLTDQKPWNDIATEKYLPFIEVDKNIELENTQFINLFEISKEFPSERIYTFKSEENLVENIKEGEIDFWHPNQLGNAYIAKVILKEIFEIGFDPELYWKDTLAGEKYPKY